MPWVLIRSPILPPQKSLNKQSSAGQAPKNNRNRIRDDSAHLDWVSNVLAFFLNRKGASLYGQKRLIDQLVGAMPSIQHGQDQPIEFPEDNGAMSQRADAIESLRRLQPRQGKRERPRRRPHREVRRVPVKLNQIGQITLQHRRPQ